MKDSTFKMSQGPGQKLEFAFDRNGGTTADLEWLSTGTNLGKAILLARGEAELVMKTKPASPPPTIHQIDLSSPCRLPFTGAEVEVHRGTGIVSLERKGDDLYMGEKQITLFRSEKQIGGKVATGHAIRKELEKRGQNLSAKVLDCLEDNPKLWPESWKKDSAGNTIYVFFWDDIFCRSGGRLYVRYGCWGEGRVVSDFCWLDFDWDDYYPAAVLVPVVQPS